MKPTPQYFGTTWNESAELLRRLARGRKRGFSTTREGIPYADAEAEAMRRQSLRIARRAARRRFPAAWEAQHGGAGDWGFSLPKTPVAAIRYLTRGTPFAGFAGSVAMAPAAARALLPKWKEAAPWYFRIASAILSNS